MDDRYILFDKLFRNISYTNLNVLILSNCSLLFDDKLQFYNKYILKLLPNMVSKVYYADFSNNNLTLAKALTLTSMFQK